jgi:hypothetical protein
MARDIDRVCEKYELKLRTGRMPGRVDGDREVQIAAFRRGAERAEVMRSAVAAVLDREGVVTIYWAYYYDFGRQLAKMQTKDWCLDTLRIEARMQLEVWVARGLKRSVLECIGLECFELDLTGSIPSLATSAGQT